MEGGRGNGRGEINSLFILLLSKHYSILLLETKTIFNLPPSSINLECLLIDRRQASLTKLFQLTNMNGVTVKINDSFRL